MLPITSSVVGNRETSRISRHFGSSVWIAQHCHSGLIRYPSNEPGFTHLTHRTKLNALRLVPWVTLLLVDWLITCVVLWRSYNFGLKIQAGWFSTHGAITRVLEMGLILTVLTAQVLGPEVIEQLNARTVKLASEHKLMQGRRLRVDTTVVETNIHYPTDSSLLADGARVLTRTMTRIGQVVGGLKTKLRDRLRTIRKQALVITLSAKQKDDRAEERRKQTYREMIAVTRNVVNQAKRVMEEVRTRRRPKVKALREQVGTMIGRVEQVIRQTKARVFDGNLHADKLVSVFEPHSEIIRKGKANRPNEFRNLVKIQEAEHQIITHYQVFAQRPSDSELLLSAVEAHQQQLGKTPQIVAADAGFYSAANEKALEQLGVKHISVPSRNTRSQERRRIQKSRWFRRAQKWRTGCERRISALKRRHGLRRCFYRGFAGMQRWVGLGVIADNLINIASRLNQIAV